jgi:hypothetical protein
LRKGEWLDLKSADDALIDEQVEVLEFASAGADMWKVPQWALFRTAHRADGDFVALVFKGTIAPTEWVVDFACTTTDVGRPHVGLKLHSGISANLRPHLETIQGVLRREELEGLPLYFAGHSLGGAYAMCSFYMMPSSISDRVRRVLGFGAPLVTGAEHLGDLEVVQKARTRFLIYVAGDDIVPRLLYKRNAERIVELFKPKMSAQQFASASESLPSFEPVGEFRALPGADARQPSELLPIRPDAPLNAHIDDHACLESYAHRLDDVLTRVHHDEVELS